MVMPAEARPAGLLENWSIYRVNHGIYKNVLVAMKYVPKKSIALQDFRALVERSLRKRILLEQPLLRCVVDGATSDRPCFRVTHFEELPIQVIEQCSDLDAFFVREHEDGPTNERLWRVSIVPQGLSFWVSFAFHHGVGDGTSGLIFHELLLKALQELTDTSDLALPKGRFLPPSVEDSGLRMPYPWRSLMRNAVLKLPLPAIARTYLDPPYYGGRKTTIEQRLNRKTYLKTFTLTHEHVGNLRRIAKLNKISIHALLHAAALHSVNTNLPIKTSTPINLRPLMPDPTERVIANYACGHYSMTPRLAEPLATARAYYAELNDPRSRQEAMAAVASLQLIDNAVDKDGVSSIERVLLDRLRTKNDHSLGCSLEISNLGNWVPPALGDWRVDHVHFSGSNAALGELLCVGVATVAGGIMNVTCTTTKSFIDDADVDQFMDSFKKILLELPDK